MAAATLASLISEMSQLELDANSAATNVEALTDLYLTSFQYIHQRAISMVEVLLDDAPNLEKVFALMERLEKLKNLRFQKIESDVAEFQGADLGMLAPVAQSSRPLRGSGPRVVNDLISFNDDEISNNARQPVQQERLKSSQLWLFDSADDAPDDASGSSDTKATESSSSQQQKPKLNTSGRSRLTASQEKALWVWDATDAELFPSQGSNPPKPSSSSSSNQSESSQSAPEAPRRHRREIQLADPDEEISCPICTDDYKRSECFSFEQCGHTYCQDCLQGYFASKIKEKNVIDIKCPDPKCTTIVQYHEIGDVVDDELFQKYEDFSMLAALAQDPNCRWCPAKGCGNAMIADPSYPRIRCTKCSHEFCFKCQEDWHNGTCEDFQKWKVENGKADQVFEEWSGENTKPCPQCKAKILKTEGCNHMTCGNCRYEFCWLCSGKYTSNHFDLYNVLGCPGMQAQAHEDAGVAKRMGMRFLMGTGMVLGGALVVGLALPALVIGGPIYGGYKLHKHLKKKAREDRYRYN